MEALSKKKKERKRPRLVFTIFFNYVYSYGFSQFQVSTVKYFKVYLKYIFLNCYIKTSAKLIKSYFLQIFVQVILLYHNFVKSWYKTAKFIGKHIVHNHLDSKYSITYTDFFINHTSRYPTDPYGKNALTSKINSHKTTTIMKIYICS